jgi:hypothetical protein
MTLEQWIIELTARTPSGGSCTIGDSSFIVRYCADIWEWEYRGEAYYDPEDLAEAIIGGYPPNSRFASFFTGKISDQRRWPRLPPAPVPRSQRLAF